MSRVEQPMYPGSYKRRCILKFVNCTSRTISVKLIYYGGHVAVNETLLPGNDFQVHTYDVNPWIAEDQVTKTRMLLNNRMVFYPSSLDPVVLDENGTYVCQVLITLPVLSLAERSAEVAARHFPPGNDINSSTLPTYLKSLLKSFKNPHFK